MNKYFKVELQTTKVEKHCSKARYVASKTSGRNLEIDDLGTRYKASSAPKQLPATKYLTVTCNCTVQEDILSFVCSAFLCMVIRVLLLATPKTVLQTFLCGI
jgi:hypothetical protein